VEKLLAVLSSRVDRENTVDYDAELVAERAVDYDELSGEWRAVADFDAKLVRS
jgi:hypothetical protein